MTVGGVVAEGVIDDVPDVDAPDAGVGEQAVVQSHQRLVEAAAPVKTGQGCHKGAGKAGQRGTGGAQGGGRAEGPEESLYRLSRFPVIRAGEETGGATWKAVKVKTNIADFSARLAAETGVAYAHTYILSEAGGKAGFGFKARKNLKVWLNREPRDMKYKSASVVLKAGWNRLLCKFDWAPKKKSIHAFLWNLGVSVRALPPYETETTNILWQARLPFWSSSSPVIIGDRIYLLSEPDDLVCLNKTDGKILWIRTNNYFDSLSEAEQAKPGLTEIRKKASRLQEINDSFTEMWPSTANLKEKATLQREIRDSMVKLDKDKYDHKWGEFHGTVIGTPCSDGEAVYVWNSSGVAVRYDLEGNRQWVSQISSMTKHHGYP